MQLKFFSFYKLHKILLIILSLQYQTNKVNYRGTELYRDNLGQHKEVNLKNTVLKT